MTLSEKDLKARLAKGDLVVEPLPGGMPPGMPGLPGGPGGLFGGLPPAPTQKNKAKSAAAPKKQKNARK